MNDPQTANCDLDQNQTACVLTWVSIHFKSDDIFFTHSFYGEFAMKRTEFEHSFVPEPMSFDAASDYPAGDKIFFECKLCGDVVASKPVDTAECSCGNLVVDADSGTLAPRHGHGTILVLHARPAQGSLGLN